MGQRSVVLADPEPDLSRKTAHKSNVKREVESSLEPRREPEPELKSDPEHKHEPEPTSEPIFKHEHEQEPRAEQEHELESQQEPEPTPEPKHKNKTEMEHLKTAAIYDASAMTLNDLAEKEKHSKPSKITFAGAGIIPVYISGDKISKVLLMRDSKKRWKLKPIGGKVGEFGGTEPTRESTAAAAFTAKTANTAATALFDISALRNPLWLGASSRYCVFAVQVNSAKDLGNESLVWYDVSAYGNEQEGDDKPGYLAKKALHIMGIEAFASFKK